MSFKLFKLLASNASRVRAMAGETKRLPVVISYHPQGPKGDMLKYQSSLPKLPVPPLQQSLQKYLKAVRPLVNDAEFKRTHRVVEEFGMKNGIGEELQKALEDRAKSCDNWLKEWWDRVAYLGFRDSVVINSNPSIMHPKNCFTDDTSFIKHATKVAVASARYMLLLRSELVPPEVGGNGPLCMSQHANLLSCCRVPCSEVDIQIRPPVDKSRHIVVAHNGHFYSLEMLSLLPDGSYALVPAQHIEEQLHKIVESSPTKAQHPVGVLTSEHRDTWYTARERLIADPVNRSSLDVIERAQFVLCLDSAHPDIDAHSTTTAAHQLSVISGRCLHGNGSAYDSCNRWFDHSIQAFVSPDGGGGSNLEHSAADGVAAMQIDIYILDTIKESEELLNYNSPVPSHQLPPAQQLQWKITPESAKDIETAKMNIDKAVSNCDHQIFVFEDYGKGFIKSHKLSPDSFIQIALQLTFYKIHGHLTATYESGSTRQFLYGRTDTIRGASLEALDFCKAMLDSAATGTDRAAKLVHSVKNHRQYVMEALSGQVFDRHLLGLKLLAGDEVPSLYSDPTYEKSLHHRLSTSQIPSKHDMVSGYGAMFSDGYAICYNPQEDKCLFSLATFCHCPETDTAKFGNTLIESLREMKTVVDFNIPKAKL